VGQILARHGLIQPRRRRRRCPAYSQPLVQADRPNALWRADLKGQWRLADGTLGYPLTVSDSYSRSLLLCRGLTSTHGAPVRLWREQLLRERALPLAIRTDNGSPFASVGLGGLSRLSAWWVRRGSGPSGSRPDIQNNTAVTSDCIVGWRQPPHGQPRPICAPSSVASSASAPSNNQERSHEALGRRTPAEVYERCNRGSLHTLGQF